ncbi:MAG TPA: hypothetical protein VFI18_02015, partial [Gaiellales bacterium]|nr:hypothetical protein [Gaiellales bacterium]
AEAAKARGIETRSRPVWDHAEGIAHDVEGAEAVLYVGVPGPGTAALWRDLHTADPALWLLATDGIAVDWVVRAIDADSVLGRYSIDDDGLTTSPASGRLAIADGELVWDRGDPAAG